MKVVIFLQNAWSWYYAGSKWPRASWLRALWNSPTGRRVKILIDTAGPDITWWIDETTEEVADIPAGICPADETHIQDVLQREAPDLVVACGKQAEQAIQKLWQGATLILPHPAYRVLTNQLYIDAGTLIKAGITGTVTLRQERPAA